MIADNVYYLAGEAIDVDTLFRIRDQIVSECFDDMIDKGYYPVNIEPEIDWVINSIGRVDYQFKWKLISIVD